MSGARELLERFGAGRFLFDPERMTPEVSDLPGGRRLVFHDSSSVIDFEAEIMLFGDAGGQAHAAFVPRSKSLIRALGAFARRHRAAIPARFDRRWSDRDAPAEVAASLDDMIRKTVENMHMVHTAAPALLPPFPLEYLASAGPGSVSGPETDAVSGPGGGFGGPLTGAGSTGDALTRWRLRLDRLMPEGSPVLSRDDRSRLLRTLMTDERLLDRHGDAAAAMAAVRTAVERMDMPREEWVRGDDGAPLRPAPPSLVLARLTSIRWMNETAEVYAARKAAGLRSSFGTFVSLLAALPDRDGAPPHGAASAPSLAAASAAARLVNWMTAHLNFYPLDGLGHRSDRIDFITTRLLFEEILNPFYAACVAAGREDLRHLPGHERLRILRALRDGFLHESALPPAGRPGWTERVGALFGRTPAAALPVERVSPLFRFSDRAPLFFAPLADPTTAMFESVLYGIGRSISDGSEAWSEALLKRNLVVLVALAARHGAGPLDNPGVTERGVELMNAIAGDPVRWDELSPRDQAYVTPAELVGPSFRKLPADWRSRARG